MTARVRALATLFSIGVVTAGGLARADDSGVVAPGYSVPDIPALTVLNATSNKIDRPASASELGAAVSQVVAADGTIQSGVGLEFSFRTFGVGKRWTYDDYVHTWWRRTLSQSAISFGTAAASSPTAAGATTASPATDTRAAVGVRIVLWDQADPLLSPSYASAVNYARQKCPDDGNPDNFQKVADCRMAAEAEFSGWKPPAWNAGGVFLAGALSGLFADSKIQNHAWDDLSAWGAGSLPLWSFAQLAVGAVYDHRYQPSSDQFALAARLRVGTTQFRGVGDVTVYAEKPDSQPRGNWAAGVEVQIASTAWLTAHAGTDFGGPAGTGGTFNLISGIKWGYTSKPSW